MGAILYWKDTALFSCGILTEYLPVFVLTAEKKGAIV